MATLGSIAGEINSMLGNRNDVLTYTSFPSTPNMQDTDRLAIWMKEAYTEICLGYRFEELEQAVPGVFIPSPPTDVYALPTQCRMIRAITLNFPASNGTAPRSIRRRHIRNIRRYQTINPGPPTIYAPYNPGGQPSIIVRPIPDQAYTFTWDIQVKPTFATTPPLQTNYVALTNVQLPDDWVDILKWSTVLRGHTALVERDKAGEVQTLLFGGYDPAKGRRVPGMIQQRIASRDQVDIEDVEFGLQPQVRRFSNTP